MGSAWTSPIPGMCGSEVGRAMNSTGEVTCESLLNIGALPHGGPARTVVTEQMLGPGLIPPGARNAQSRPISRASFERGDMNVREVIKLSRR